MPTITIRAEAQQFANLFEHVLKALPRNAHEYTWRIVELHGEGDMPRAIGRNMADVLEAIGRGEPVLLSFAQLKSVAGVMSQIFDLLIVGSDVKALMRKGFDRLPSVQLCSEYDMVIEAFDSEEWSICGSTDVVESVAAHLQRIGIQPVTCRG